MANFQAFPPAGRALPRGWEAEAAKNAAEAKAHYEATVCQAWRQPLQSHAGLMQAARLEQQSPAPPAPPRRDSRADTRMDGMMLLVKDDDLEQIWKDNTGRLVTIRKRK
jgi:hypothetical protein